MNQIDQWKLAIKTEELISEKLKEIASLKKFLKDLPFCPCCPNNKGSICLIDFARNGQSEESLRESARKLGIAEENFLAAVKYEYTLTQEEFESIIIFINKNIK